ncbi:serine protease, partial [Candidatus Poribacteria bacterium]|nr:serine protease [Candidatus Poribacteria bacterium]
MRHYTKFLFSFLVPVVFLSFSCAQVISEKSDVPTETDLISDKAKESTVRIVGLGMRKSEVMMGGGTGFFIAPDKIATNFHVAANCTTGPITAKLSDKETVWLVEAVVAYDIAYDIAILKVKGEGVPLPLGDSDMLQIGEPAFLVGFPAPELIYKVTEGVVENIRKNDKRFHTTTEVYPGNSGSPVLNSKGEIIGIHYGHDPGNSPVNVIKALLAGATSTEPLAQWRQRKVVQAHFYFREGMDKFNDGNLKGAMDDFNQAIKLNPDNAENYKFRAKAKVHLGHRVSAIEDYNQAIKLNPDDVGIYKDKAKARSDFGDHTGAVEDYNQAIKINPDDADAYKKRGDTKAKLSDHEGAIVDYNQAIQLDPDDAEAYQKRGDAKGKLGDKAGKIEDHSQAIQLKSDAVQLKLDDANKYNELGHMKESVGDHAGAIEDFTHAIKLKPDDAYGYNNRGWAKMEIGDHAGAIEDFTHAIKLKP